MRMRNEKYRPEWMYPDDWGSDLGRDFRLARELFPLVCEGVSERELVSRLWTPGADSIDEPVCCALCALQWMQSVLKMADERPRGSSVN